ncbi:U3 small nucleolar ribonucleoprotein protein MPP10 isoform X2 [Quercus lobata]|uniref:U3 small nucleolar ribonucleoprotein protein MPP10 isoform X2 n=1 Tax=Quercus lobata TaxID=97700 RepID=UPI001244C2F8|nr:U3 small nucleolar ribonucleoprotein protein MPP10 isoform X2 [Quercus lobata]
MGMATSTKEPGLEALKRLKSTKAPEWLTPNPSLSQTARAASEHLFASLKPFTPKSPFEKLLTQGFDAEQIWQQIDLQSHPLMSTLRREVKRFEKNPDEISKLKKVQKVGHKGSEGVKGVVEEESDGLDEGLNGFDEELDEDEEEEEEEEKEEEERESEGEEEGEEGREGGIEDAFLKIKELEGFLEDGEAMEYGLKKKGDGLGKKSKKSKGSEEEEEEDDDDEEDDELGAFGLGDDEDDDQNADKMASYDDFFGSNKKKTSKRKSEVNVRSEDLDMGDEQEDSDMGDGQEDSDMGDEQEDSDMGDDQEDDGAFENKQETLSTHEKELQKLRSQIELMEKEDLEQKDWTMQGEVTAEKRPVNSALEVDLEFDHNVRPAPVITEEVTVALEEIIKERILKGQYDDVQKAPRLPSVAPREIKELDENKSKKGLAEVYEEEYVQQTNLNSAPLSFKDEQKKEASMLFKKLCLKLDALSHFHFAPKPVIEDMSIQANVPALAMEEVKSLLHLWLSQTQLCWLLRKFLLAKVTLRKKLSLHRQKGRGGELIRRGNSKDKLIEGISMTRSDRIEQSQHKDH